MNALLDDLDDAPIVSVGGRTASVRWDRSRAWRDFRGEPRRWQVECLEKIHTDRQNGGLVCAVMGAGKSALCAEMVETWAGDGIIVITVPTQALTEQTCNDIRRRVGRRLRIGCWYAQEKTRGKCHAWVVCFDSLEAFSESILDHWGEVVGLWIADEAHRTECDQIHAWFRRASPAWRVAMSATPYKALEHETLTLWRHEVYRYDYAAAVADSVLVPWRREAPTDGWHDLTAASVEWICSAVDRKLGPGVASAYSVEDCDTLIKALSDEGVWAYPIHYRVPKGEQRRTLDALRKGAIDLVVHVNMLVDGVNLPWLRWGALRRERNRVGFAQEVGRFLRSHYGKRFATLWDPHDMFARYALTDGSRLGEMERPEDEDAEVFDALTGTTAPRGATESERRRIYASTAAAAWATSAIAALRCDGVVPGGWGGSASWRAQMATPEQSQAIRTQIVHICQLADRVASTNVRAAAIAWTYAYRAGRELRRGIASDIILTTQALRSERTRGSALAALERYGVDPSPVIAAHAIATGRA